MDKIKKVLEKIYQDKSLRSKCIPLFLGNPGLGKTQIIKEFAKEMGVQCKDVIASQLLPHEISGMSIPDRETKMMTYFDYDMFLSLKDGDILFFDELLNANPMVLNACLTVLENRTLISGRKLPDIMIVAAANPQGASVLTPQIKERFIWYDVKFSKKLWKEYMLTKYIIPDEIMDGLTALIESEGFSNTERNYHTPRSIDKAIEMMIKGITTPYEETVGKIINTLITNETDNIIDINGVSFNPGEKKTWLKIQKLMSKQYEIINE